MLDDIEGQTYNLEWAATYQAGLAKIERQGHDVYLVDYRLGTENGLDLIRKAIKAGCEAPLILLTGRGDRNIDIEAMKVGAADYLAKDKLDPLLLERSIRHSVERKRAEATRNKLEEQLHHAQKMEAIGRLAGGVAHDFNNILTAVMSYAGLALDGVSPGHPVRDELEGIQKTARRGAELTRQLLAFARKQVIEPHVTSMKNLILNTDKLLRRLISEDIELVTLISPDVGRIKMDAGQFEQVLINLVVNACDAMPEGGKLTIEATKTILDEHYARQHPDVVPGEYAVLSVSDNGIGMSEDSVERIFEPFYTTKDRGKGTGLGLSTIFGIVKQNNGHIRVDSKPGHGTTFNVYLPCVDEPLSSISVRKEPTSLPHGTETILLVEDEVAVRSLVARVLRQHGYTVLEAGNGEEALHLVENHHDQVIHLLLTDMVMPQMGGKALADQLLTQHPDLKVLFTSGYSDKAIIHSYVLDSGIAFLPKPFAPAFLVQKVREVIEGN
jgi:two-component system cell cycle sensor histidine kinase/response regulator CckA